MITQELFSTQINKEGVKAEFKRLLKVAGGSAPIIENLFNKAIDPFDVKIARLPQLEPAALEAEFVGLRRGVNELKYYISYLFQAEKELGLTSPKVVQEELLAQCDAYLHTLASYLPNVLAWRKEQLPHNFAFQMRSALLKLSGHLETPTFLDEHALAIQSSVDYLENNFDSLERLVLEQGKSILIQETAESPLKVLYSYSGGLYVIMEIKEHLIGHGGGKVCSRALLLQTGEIVAFVRPRLLFAEKEQELREIQFKSALRESDLLFQLSHLKGVVHLKERFFFEIDGIKRVYMIEDLYSNGALTPLLIAPSPLSQDEKQAIAKELLMAVANLHAHQIVHADIKPDNLLIDLNTTPLKAALCDFNAAFDIRRHHITPQLQTNHPPEFMPFFHGTPDIKEWEKIDFKAADVWGAGALLHFLFFEQDIPWGHLNQMTQEQEIIQWISSLQGEWIAPEYKTHALYPLIQAMLSVDPKQRPTAADALLIFQRF